MKLYSIVVRHCAPKDCNESIVGYFIAENDNVIMEYINKELTSGIWEDRHNEDGLFDIRDEDLNVIKKTTYKEKMLFFRGEFYDPSASYSDAYYGITHYGWTEGKDVSEEDIDTLIRLGVAQKI
jgi:hypothetical protein